MGAVLSLCVYVGLFLLTQFSIPQPQLSVLLSTQALCDFLRGRHRFSSSRQKSRPVSWPSQHRADLATCPWVWAPVFLSLRGHSRGGQRTTSGSGFPATFPRAISPTCWPCTSCLAIHGPIFALPFQCLCPSSSGFFFFSRLFFIDPGHMHVLDKTYTALVHETADHPLLSWVL